MQDVNKPSNADLKFFLYHTMEQLSKLFRAPKSAVPIAIVTTSEIEPPWAEGRGFPERKITELSYPFS